MMTTVLSETGESKSSGNVGAGGGGGAIAEAVGTIVWV